MDDETQLLELTADIVSAHVGNNSVAVGDVANLVRQVHQALSNLGAPAPEAEPAKREAAVSARSSIKPDYLVCLVCGKKQKTIRRHISNAHGLTPDQYRTEFGLKADYPMTAPNYSETRRAMAHKIGLGRLRRTQPEDTASAKGGGRKKASRGSRKGRKAGPAGDTPPET